MLTLTEMGGGSALPYFHPIATPPRDGVILEGVDDEEEELMIFLPLFWPPGSQLWEARVKLVPGVLERAT